MYDESYELFRRAIVERDTDAWEAIATRYRGLLVSWASHSLAAHATREYSEDLADRALARAWAALSPARFAAFPSTAALLAYLRACVSATVIDAARAQTAYDRATSLIAVSDNPTPEQVALAALDRDELWRLVHSAVACEAERVALIERFVLDLPPRAIQARHPRLFADVPAVYAALRNVRERLRRNHNLQQLYLDRQVA